ncbi:MAG: hypothetical protein AB7S26_02025 [Sandaracinaceae bacterium]
MALSSERLAAIDRELDAFGKSDEDLARVIAAARAAAESDGDDAMLAELLEGRDAALARARASARDAVLSASREAAPPREKPVTPPITTFARPKAEETPTPPPLPRSRRPSVRPGRSSGPPSGSVPLAGTSPGHVQSPIHDSSPPSFGQVSADPGAHTELRVYEQEDLSSSLNAQIEDAFGSEPPPAETSDIAGMSVDELFADADPSPSVPPTNLDQLFEDEADADGPRASDPDVNLGLAAALEGDVASRPPPPVAPPPPRPRTAPPPPPPSRMPPPPPRLQDFARFDAEEDATQVVRADDLEELEGDDFELLVDEDVLEVNVEETPAEDAPKEGGLISRILSRK